ncbi:MAG: DUF4398 domain-containing protein [Burkholderiaceae bacterium]
MIAQHNATRRDPIGDRQGGERASTNAGTLLARFLRPPVQRPHGPITDEVFPMQSIRFKSGRLVLGALLAGTLAACASVPRPTTELSAARTSIDSRAGRRRRCRDAGPCPRPLDAAENAAANDDNTRARRLAEQANVDAQLAEARAEAERSEQAALELETSLETLRRELDRGNSQ